MKRKVFKECDGRRARSCEDSRKGSTANLQTRQNTDKVVRTCRGKWRRVKGDGDGDGDGDAQRGTLSAWLWTYCSLGLAGAVLVLLSPG